MVSSVVEEAGNKLLTSGPESRDWARRKAGLQSISLQTPNDSPPPAKPYLVKVPEPAQTVEGTLAGTKYSNI